MGEYSIKPYANVQSRQFKEAMEELAKNKRLTLDAAERAIGLEADFTVQVARGIKELTLEDVIKIAKFFGTTMDSVLAGGRTEIRIENKHSSDRIVFQCFTECVKAYVNLLNDMGMNARLKGIMDDDIEQQKVQLEEKEGKYIQRYCIYIEEYDCKKIQPMDAARCCDEVLINELARRGYKVEKGN